MSLKVHVLSIQCFLSKAHCRCIGQECIGHFPIYKAMPMSQLGLAAKHKSQTRDHGAFLYE